MIEPDIREPDMIKIRPRFTNKLTSQGIHTLKKKERNLFWKESPINIFRKKCETILQP